MWSSPFRVTRKCCPLQDRPRATDELRAPENPSPPPFVSGGGRRGTTLPGRWPSVSRASPDRPAVAPRPARRLLAGRAGPHARTARSEATGRLCHWESASSASPAPPLRRVPSLKRACLPFQQISANEIETLLMRLPRMFKQEFTGVGATLEKRWKLCAFEGIKTA